MAINPHPVTTDFDRGVLVAASLIVFTHGMTEVAADVLLEAGLTVADCSELTEFDKRNLRKVQTARKGQLALRGLHAKS